MAQLPEPAGQDTPLRFLETEQFQEMLSTYQKLKPLEKDHPRKFKNQMNTYDFGDIYPLMDKYLQTHDLSTPEAVAAVIADGNGRPDVADFPAADVAQCGHDLANKGVEPFGTVIGIGLDRHVIPLLSQLLPWPLLLPASSGSLHSSHRLSADGRRCGSGGVFPGSFPVFPGGRLHIPRPCRSPGR